MQNSGSVCLTFFFSEIESEGVLLLLLACRLLLLLLLNRCCSKSLIHRLCRCGKVIEWVLASWALHRLIRVHRHHRHLLLKVHSATHLGTAHLRTSHHSHGILLLRVTAHHGLEA